MQLVRMTVKELIEVRAIGGRIFPVQAGLNEGELKNGLGGHDLRIDLPQSYRNRSLAPRFDKRFVGANILRIFDWKSTRSFFIFMF